MTSETEDLAVRAKLRRRRAESLLEEAKELRKRALQLEKESGELLADAARELSHSCDKPQGGKADCKPRKGMGSHNFFSPEATSQPHKTEAAETLEGERE